MSDHSKCDCYICKLYDTLGEEHVRLQTLDIKHSHQLLRCATIDGYICKDPNCNLFLSGKDLAQFMSSYR